MQGGDNVYHIDIQRFNSVMALRGLTATQLAKKAKLSAPTITAIRKGKRPSLKTMDKLRIALELTAEEAEQIFFARDLHPTQVKVAG
jgi:transcriptional regulator with XRE-family HTH domain